MFGANAYLYTEYGLKTLPKLFSDKTKNITIWSGSEEVVIPSISTSVDTNAVRLTLSNGQHFIAHLNQEVQTVNGFMRIKDLPHRARLIMNMEEGLFGDLDIGLTAYNYGVNCNLYNRIPFSIFSANRTSVIEFIRGLLDKNARDRYATLKGHPVVLRQLQLLLNNLGIITTRTKDTLQCPFLTSIYRYMELFQYNVVRGIKWTREDYVKRLNPFVIVTSMVEANPNLMYSFIQPEADHSFILNGIVFRMRPHSVVGVKYVSQ